MFWIIFLFIVSGALIIYGGLLSGWRYLHEEVGRFETQEKTSEEA